MSVAPSGSPPDTRNTTLNMLNVHTAPNITDGNKAGRSNGNMTVFKLCHRVAPSRAAASSSSLGMRDSAPSVTTIMKGKPSHTLVVKLAANAVEKRENQEMGSRLSA